MTFLFDQKEKILIRTGGYIQCKIISFENETISIDFMPYFEVRHSQPSNFFEMYRFYNNTINCNINKIERDIKDYCCNNYMSDKEASKILDTIFRIFAKCNIKIISIDFNKTIFAQSKKYV